MSKPNLIFCHVDQMHWRALSCLGNPDVKTPNLDRMFSLGTSFHNHWSANAICMPARTSWYTGTPSYTHDTLTNNVSMRENLPDLGQWMSSRGYDCYYAGKWHISRDITKSFKVVDFGSPYGEALDSSVTRSALSFFEKYEGEQPFFLSLGYLNPHDCCYLDNMEQGYAIKLGLEKKVDLPPLPKTATEPPGGQYASVWNDEQRRLYIWYYYRMMEMVDAEIGTVFKGLETSRFAENTLFIFTADHGEQLMEHNETKKNKPWEASCRVPLLVIGPGVRKGIRDTVQISGGTDITATILDYAGMERMPEMTDPVSLRPALERADAARLKNYVISERYYLPGKICDRTVYFDNWKAVFDRKKGSVSLYNIADDPDELQDLAARDASRPVIARASAYVQEWAGLHKPCGRVLNEPVFRISSFAGTSV